MNFLSVTPADDLQAILDKIAEPTTIYMKNGVYRQKIVINADDVKLIGEDRENTVITYADYAKKANADGKEYNTFRTFTVCVTGERTVMENLTVGNANTEPEKVGQCVALSVCGGLFRAKNLKLVSTQDTLFTAPFPDDLVARYSGLSADPASGETYYRGFIPEKQLYREGGSLQLYENCKIFGNTDFIFGGAEAYFYKCELVSLKDNRGTGYVCAPSHPLREACGYTFIGCEFRSGGAEAGSVYLARPWRDFGKCVFVGCKLGGHINAKLFDKWNDSYRDNTARFSYNSLSGISAAPVSWAKELTDLQASEIINRFTVRKKQYFDGI